ncbi:probable leucine-rich repeat receptor-like protein kinase At1g35710 [Mangifera indica]|uniref:probable leucine-rich repeat receptor-like protein kinase At1g35710 n=1 Tax=Mangifera indica TaxID=29780 RepID=UPI001CFB6458|nr:probable leucine-rich repeat receptor-like protein kinase At1g35710 [Mangifera indica]
MEEMEAKISRFSEEMETKISSFSEKMETKISNLSKEMAEKISILSKEKEANVSFLREDMERYMFILSMDMTLTEEMTLTEKICDIAKKVNSLIDEMNVREEIEIKEQKKKMKAAISRLRKTEMFGKKSRVIPLEIGRLSNLVELDLAFNNLGGTTPSSLCNLTQSEYLDLSSNKLEGLVPQDLRNLRNLTLLYLYENNLNGPIPSTLGLLIHLRFLSLSTNNLNGSIPSQISALSQLKILSLHNNYLTGVIPPDIGRLSNLVGLTPKDCVSSCCNFLPITTVLIILIIGFLFPVKRKDKNAKLEIRETKNGNVFSIWNCDGTIAFENMIEATEDFDIKYCIGTGANGSVYKAQLPNDRTVALKKLHNSELLELAFLNSFQNEAHILSKIRHRNIVKLYGFCLHKKCMFLIYEYMERESLFCILHNDDEVVELDWSKRVNIVRNIAHALSYLHHDCVPSIVYHDISNNNILLNSELEAFVADFGLVRLLHPNSSNRAILTGTHRYIAPVLEL